MLSVQAKGSRRDWHSVGTHSRPEPCLLRGRPRYALAVELLIGLWVVVMIPVVVFLVGFARWARRFWHDEEELQPGGSIGRQLFGRDKS